MDRGNAKRLVRDMSAHQISMTNDFDEWEMRCDLRNLLMQLDMLRQKDIQVVAPD